MAKEMRVGYLRLWYKQSKAQQSTVSKVLWWKLHGVGWGRGPGVLEGV
jgi:hypothetical protein